MKKSFNRSRQQSEGSSLLAVLFVIVAASVIVASVATLTQSSAQLAYRSRQMTSATYAAEALLERAYLIWQKEMVKSPKGRATNGQLKAAIKLDQLIPKETENDKLAALSYPATFNGVDNLSIYALKADGTPITESEGLPAAFETSNSGAPAVVFRYRIVAYATSEVSGKSPITIGVERTFTRRDDSLSMGVFLQDSAGIHPGDKLIFDKECQVHSNGTIYAASYANTANSFLQFQGPVSYVNGYVEGFPPGQTTSTPKAPVWNDSKAYSNSGTRAEQLKPSPMLKPAGIDQGTQGSPDNPNTAGGYREIIEIPQAGEDPYSAARMYNLADIIILVNQTNASEQNPKVTVTVMGNGGTELSSGATNAIIRALTSPKSNTVDRGKIYDRREQADVEVTTLRLDALGDAIASNVPNFNGVLYIGDVSKSASGKKKAIRLTNGARLPGSQSSKSTPGFTVASMNPIYIQGDYNTDSRNSAGDYNPANLPSNQSTTGKTETSEGAHIPAAILADAVTLLSNSWSDDRSALYEPGDRPASSTTVQASIVAGVSLVKSESDQHIQGGAHNILRLLEDWTGDTLTFNGSLTQLYGSQEFNGTWSVYPIYYPGNRRIMYDAGLRQRRPPGQPPITTFTRGEWRRI